MKWKMLIAVYSVHATELLKSTQLEILQSDYGTAGCIVQQKEVQRGTMVGF